jgi:hypothetical protein
MVKRKSASQSSIRSAIHQSKLNGVLLYVHRPGALLTPKWMREKFMGGGKWNIKAILGKITFDLKPYWILYSNVDWIIRDFVHCI